MKMELRLQVRQLLQMLVLLLCLVLGLGQVSAQSPYEVEWGRGLAVVGTGVATFAVGQRASARMEILRVEELERLDVNDIFPIDRFATRQKSLTANKISDIIGYGSTALPLAFLAGDRSRKYADDVGLLYGQVILLSDGITHLVKNTVRRSRPYTYRADAQLSLKQRKDARRSFFSGHTSHTAANAFFTAKAYSDLYPHASAKHWVWAGAIILPAVTGTTRVLAGKHYWTDVVVGYLVGAGIGLLVPEVNLR